MKTYKTKIFQSIFFSSSILLVSTITSCDKSEDNIVGTGTVTVEFDNRANGNPLLLNKDYINENGETMNFSVIRSSTTYSSNVIVNDLPANITDPFSGRLFSITGGSVSFGPPVGALILAHERAKSVARTVSPRLPDMYLPQSTTCKLTSNFVT